MAYQAPARNSDSIRWQEIRLRADVAQAEMHDEFCAAYYDYWRHGNSHPWGPFDVLATREETDEQHRLMQIMIHCMGVMMFHKINHRMNQLGEPGVIPQDEYRYTYTRDDDGNIIDTHDEVQWARDEMARVSALLGVKAKTMMDHYRKRIKELNGDDYDFPNWDIP